MRFSTYDQKRRSATVGVFAPGLHAGGGAEATAVRAAVACAATGRDTVLWTDQPCERQWVEEHFGVSLDNVQLAVLPELPCQLERLPLAIRYLCRDWMWRRAMGNPRPDLFLNLKFKSSLPGVGRKNVYYAHFPHHIDVPPRGVVHRAYLRLMGIGRRLALREPSGGFVAGYDEVVANSQFTADHVRRRWGVPARVIYPPCTLLPRVSGDVPRRKNIVSVGRFQVPGKGIPQKNQHVLIEAFSTMTEAHDAGWRLSLVGALPQDPAGQEYFRSLQGSAKELPVDFFPDVTRSQLNEILSAARIYWHAQGFGSPVDELPETQEHFGISTVEAMSAGLVPLVYYTAGPREIVSSLEPELGWLTIHELREKTRAIASDNETLRKLSDNARKVSENYSSECFVERIVQLVEELLR